MNVVQMKFARFPVLPILISSLNANFKDEIELQVIFKQHGELIMLLLLSVALSCRNQTGNEIFHKNVRFGCFHIAIAGLNQLTLLLINS